MSKNEIIDLINSFSMETWQYEESDQLYNDMDYLVFMEKEIKKADENNLENLYNRLLSVIGLIRLKHGFESSIINNAPELESIKETLNNMPIDSNDIEIQYESIFNVFNNYINNVKNLNFIVNKYKDIQGKEGLYLAEESLKSLIENNDYRKLIDDNKIKEVIIDMVKLNNGKADLKKLETKYNDIIKFIWERSLTNNIDEEGKFRFLFSNITGGNLRDQANALMNRPGHSSCSMISSNFIATYLGSTRRIGFIYPNDSQIEMISAYDLSSNVFGSDSVNKEKGTKLSTPKVLEQIGISRTTKKEEDLYSSSSYNEILVNSKPCAIALIGLGENDLNIDYQEAINLSAEMNLPLYNINTLNYKNSLSEVDKEYITFHSLLSYYGISRDELIKKSFENNGLSDLSKLMNQYKDDIVNVFLTLQQEGNLNKENMFAMMNNIVNNDLTEGKSR